MKKDKRKQSKLLIVSTLVPLVLLLIVGYIYIGPLFGLPSVGSLFQENRSDVDQAVEETIAELEQEIIQLQTQLRETENELAVMSSASQQSEEETGVQESASVPSQMNGPTDQENRLRSVVNTYKEMSSKRAAAIIDELPFEEAFSHVQAMDESLRASIIGRLPAEKGAELIERLANEGG
ncbi:MULTISPECIES: magnesium transporter MgtE N-terminal domain-containing protein [Bacillaceae]|uniref:Magnesium transporter MgtE intracellular domain-containing protein n=1 Tax=Alkalicoccobacillus plakortidis TaxID=444060 RepID=A0A9D5I2D5_9BACI|nr:MULTISPECIES: hypothetical protein [Bacillaceae]KQL58639.1 hypothetical protein AN965_01290 [Alkalicoccobacillus plakortidis]